jgi:hypothetical protein
MSNKSRAHRSGSNRFTSPRPESGGSGQISPIRLSYTARILQAKAYRCANPARQRPVARSRRSWVTRPSDDAPSNPETVDEDTAVFPAQGRRPWIVRLVLLILFLFGISLRDELTANLVFVLLSNTRTPAGFLSGCCTACLGASCA